MTTLSDLVDLVAGLERSIAGLQAARDGALAMANRWAMGVASDLDESDLSLRSVAAELGAALRVTDRTVQRRMLAAEVLVERFPLVWAAQGAGQITAGHARVIIDAGEHLDDVAAREEFSRRVISFAEHESANRVRPYAERLAQQYEERSLTDRHQEAREKRGIWVRDDRDGMAELSAYGPAALIHGAFDRLTQMAKLAMPAEPEETDPENEERAGDADLVGPVQGPAADGRTMDQRRLDIAMDLLLTGAPAGHDSPDGALAAITAQVSVTIPALSLVGSDVAGSVPPELAGRAPIDPETARRLAGAASGWDRLLTHPVSGELLAVDRYRPSEHLRRLLRARDQLCRFPGCGMPARDSDLDHTHDAALGGATAEHNLGTLCRRHHVLKHQTPWKVKQLGDGLLEWASPTGRTYIDRPPPQHTVTFTEAPF